jgi:hypothetical protein
MAPSCVVVDQKELGYPATTLLHLGLKHVGCTAPTEAEMFYEVRTTRSIEMQVKRKLNGKSVVKRVYSLRFLSSSAGT